MREIYAKSATEHIVETEGFKECMQLINFQSQLILVDTIKNAVKLTEHTLETASPKIPLKSILKKPPNDKALGKEFVRSIKIHLGLFLRQIENANAEDEITQNVEVSEEDIHNFDLKGSRYKLKEVS